MEQGRFSLTPRTQRRSQNSHSDVAKIGIFLITSKLLGSFLQFSSKKKLLVCLHTSRIDMIYIFSRLPSRGVRLPSIQLSSWNFRQNVA